MKEFTKEQLEAIKIVDSLYKTKSDVDFAYDYFLKNTDKIPCIKKNLETESYNFQNVMPKIFCDLIGMIIDGDLVLKK